MNIVRSLLIFFWMIVCCGIALLACALRPFGVDTNVVASRLFSWLVIKVAKIDLHIEDAGKVQSTGPAIVVANHQGGLDMATFGRIFPHNAKIIGKKQLLWIPLMGVYFLLSGNVLINRAKGEKAQAVLAEAMKTVMKACASVWIFPEGTRNTSSEPMLPFKKGAFHMAIAGQIPILPMVSSSLRDVASLEKKFYNGGRVTVRVLDPIPTKGLTVKDVDALSAKTRSVMIAALADLEQSRR